MTALGVPSSFMLVVALVFGSAFGAGTVVSQPRGPELAGFTSARFNLEYRLETENVAVRIPGTGAFVVDPATMQPRLQLVLTAFGESLELRSVDGRMYMKLSTEPDWEDLGAAGSAPPPAAMADLIPPQQMAALQRAVAIVPTTVEEVDGVETTRWAVDVDTPAVLEVFGAFARMAGSRSPQAGAITGDADVDALIRSAKVTGMLWVENETGYLRQVQSDLFLNVPTRKDQATGQSKTIGVHQQLVVRLRDHNAAVAIDPPPGIRPPARPTPRAAPPRATPTPTPAR